VHTRTLVATGASILLLGTLTACASDSENTAAESTAPTATCPVTVTDPWVKAAESGMTAGFGVLANSGAQAVTITAASSPASPTMELHEVVESDGAMVMRPVEGGFEVPAGGSLAMEPGGYHLMLMDLTDPVLPGDDVAFTLTCGDGGTVSYTAQAKTFEGAAEDYEPGMDMDHSHEPSEAPSP
jgi:hypothetical protein